MNSRRRRLAAALSSIISDVLTLLFPLLHPDYNPLLLSTHFDFDSLTKISPLLNHALVSSNLLSTAAATALTTIDTRKRKRDTFDPDFNFSDESTELGLVRPSPGRISINPDSFKLHFKISSSTFEWLSSLLEPLLDCRDPIHAPLNLSPDVRLAIGLTRLASGSGYDEIGTRFGVSEYAARFCTKQLCRVLCTNYKFWVGYPIQDHEIENVASGFRYIAGLPNCCGVILCHRFEVKTSLKSIAAQIVVDCNSRILSIAAGFHGDKSDYSVLKGSTVFKDVENGTLLGSSSKLVNLDGIEIRRYFVSGNGGYPLLPWLMTPFVNPVKGSDEERFNNAIHLMRISAFKAIASLRSWGVLSGSIDGDFRTGVKYIGACSILHNVLLMRDEELTLADGFEVDLKEREGFGFCREVGLEENEGLQIRNALAKNAKQLGTNENRELSWFSVV